MSQSNSHHLKLNHDSASRNGSKPGSNASSTAGHPDSAIDAALRSVPLPQGLMTRLSLLAYTIPEDAPDAVDWLGC